MFYRMNGKPDFSKIHVRARLRKRPHKSDPAYAVASRASGNPTRAVATQSLHFFLLEIGSLWATLLCALAQQGSHAQGIPLNMGAVHCVTGGHIRGYKAHTPGEVKDTLHPL